jgi:hypothetical protein
MHTFESPVFLGSDAPVPVDRPFTRRQARANDVSDRRLTAWVSAGLLLNPLRGVFHAAQLSDGLDLRVACLRLVIPENAVVTGRTAGWLHGAPMILAPGDHLQVPRVEMHLTPGNRLRNALASGGERTFLPREVVDLDGLRVASKLRTSVDLGMGLRRGQAFAAMCSLAKVADYEPDELRYEIRERGRFAGYRGVRQIRLLEPWVDPDYGSAAECALGLAWHEQPGMPPPVLQHPVSHPEGSYYLDLSAPQLKYGAEYNGPRWHGSDRTAYDAERIAWLVDHDDWIIDVFERADVYGPGRDAGLRLRQGVERARRRFGSLSWTGQTRDGDSWLG